MNHLYKRDLTNGSIAGSMLRFALPLMLGNLLQQCYNIADTLIVGQVTGHSQQRNPCPHHFVNNHLRRIFSPVFFGNASRPCS